ncbi:MAG: L,D-transpeptidase family protein [Ilumatobacteraceae bacterium]
MHKPIEIIPKRPNATSTHLEVYLVSQTAVLFKDNEPELITHISSGSGEEWEEEITIDPGTPENETEEPITKVLAGTSITPGGVYSFYRRYVKDDGWRTGSLGRMYKPVYFNYGVAVHGAGNVPNRPASHGCVRIPMHIAEYFPDLVRNNDQVFIFDGVHDPEYYGSPSAVRPGRDAHDDDHDHHHDDGAGDVDDREDLDHLDHGSDDEHGGADHVHDDVVDHEHDHHHDGCGQHHDRRIERG